VEFAARHDAVAYADRVAARGQSRVVAHANAGHDDAEIEREAVSQHGDAAEQRTCCGFVEQREERLADVDGELLHAEQRDGLVGLARLCAFAQRLLLRARKAAPFDRARCGSAADQSRYAEQTECDMGQPGNRREREHGPAHRAQRSRMREQLAREILSQRDV
jgi:hypothetical protein